MTTMAAVDLGASSGRVITGTLAEGRLELREVTRFPNGPVELRTDVGPRLHWDVLRLWSSTLEGLRVAHRQNGALESVGIDTWAVDYGLLDTRGALLGNPSSYRCSRTAGAPERLFSVMSPGELYAATGLQVMPINTIFQLLAESADQLARAQDLLLIPDLLSFWLTGRRVAEVTNASTTGLLDPRSRLWRTDVLNVLADSFDRHVEPLLPELVEPGNIVGSIELRDAPLTTASGAPTPLVAVGTHDTASAVVAVPTERLDYAYISCGTWSLVGLELDGPVLTEAARRANLTNELGVDGTVRFLKNVMGLWVFNESARTWEGRGITVDIPALVRDAASVPALRTVIDVDRPEFFPPGDMPSRIAAEARRTGQPEPRSPAEIARCIFDSLALAYAHAVRQASEIAAHDVGVLHIVGGGARNELLCQLTADATGLDVVAGPAEATAMGNLVIQARAVGALEGGLQELRQVVRNSSDFKRYRPVPGTRAMWDSAARRIGA